ncbi:rCG22017 [Rattus norvegicus]|uniref:RCG22017 n=1 Tax=Rattus norvegicus TaxID=10116 RepID=A6K4B6_RAT|nr:rCG22017 [Rattus norvegicus]
MLNDLTHRNHEGIASEVWSISESSGPRRSPRNSPSNKQIRADNPE